MRSKVRWGCGSTSRSVCSHSTSYQNGPILSCKRADGNMAMPNRYVLVLLEQHRRNFGCWPERPLIKFPGTQAQATWNKQELGVHSMVSSCSRSSGERIRDSCHSAEVGNDMRPPRGWCDSLGLGVLLVDSPAPMQIGRASGEAKTELKEEA